MRPREVLYLPVARCAAPHVGHTLHHVTPIQCSICLDRSHAIANQNEVTFTVTDTAAPVPCSQPGSHPYSSSPFLFSVQNTQRKSGQDFSSEVTFDNISRSVRSRVLGIVIANGRRAVSRSHRIV